jgi:hypothetical protein
MTGWGAEMKRKPATITISRLRYERLLAISRAMKDFASWTRMVDARERRKIRALRRRS